MKEEYSIILATGRTSQDRGELANISPARQRLIKCEARVMEPIDTNDLYLAGRTSFRDVYDLFTANRQVDIDEGRNCDGLDIDSFQLFVGRLKQTAETALEKGIEENMRELNKGKPTFKRTANAERKNQKIRNRFGSILRRTGDVLFMLSAYREMPKCVEQKYGIEIGQMFEGKESSTVSLDIVIDAEYRQI